MMQKVLVLVLLLTAAPSHACDTQGSSTFCADGIMTQPVTIPRKPAAEGQGYDSAPPGSDQGIYVEGAVPVTDGADDGEL